MKYLTTLLQHSLVFGIAGLLMTSCMVNTQKFTSQLNKEPFDAIIVPGYPFEDGKWSEIIKLRVYWALHLYKKGITKNIIFSGGSVYTPFIESRIMALYAIELGVPEENIFTEEEAEHSCENLFYSVKLAKLNGFKNIALATDPFQDMFLRKHIKNMNLKELKTLPILFKELNRKDMITPVINAEYAFVENFISLKEREDKKTRKKASKGKLITFETL
jgi:hypothetical protein